MARDYTLNAIVPPPEVPFLEADGTVNEEWRLALEAVFTALFGPAGGEDVTRPLSGDGVRLGQGTSGDYVAAVSGGEGVGVAGGQGEGSNVIVSIGQPVGPADSPSFDGLTVGGQNILTALGGKVDRAAISSAVSNHPTRTDFAGVKGDLDALGAILLEIRSRFA